LDAAGDVARHYAGAAAHVQDALAWRDPQQVEVRLAGGNLLGRLTAQLDALCQLTDPFFVWAVVGAPRVEAAWLLVHGAHCEREYVGRVE
jgi:hypothetical protein